MTTYKQFWTRVFAFYGSVILFGGFLLVIILPAMTVNKTVKQSEYGIGYNTYTCKFTEIYDQGKHTLAVGEHLKKIKRTVNDYSSTLQCITSDKILIDIDWSMQYTYEQQYIIPKIFKEHNNKDQYNKFIMSLAISSIKSSCVEFTAEDYYINRSSIDARIYENFETDINTPEYGVYIENFQLVNIKFPTRFSDVINVKQNTDQSRLTALNNRNSVLTNANTNLLQAQTRARTILNNANNTAMINLNKAQELVNIEDFLWETRLDLYAKVKNDMNLTPSQVVEYIHNDLIHKKKDLMYTVD